MQDALDAIFKGSKYGKHSVVASLPADETVVREIPVPFKSDDQIKKVVKYEAEHHLHDCDADDVIVQYTRVGETAEGTNLLVFAIRKNDISRRIEYARGSGVEPLAMDLDAAAFYNAVSASGELETTPTCVLINIQHRATDLVFVVDGKGARPALGPDGRGLHQPGSRPRHGHRRRSRRTRSSRRSRATRPTAIS